MTLLMHLVNGQLSLISFAAGFEFFESANGVILCPGDEHGLLPTRLFAKVVHKKGTRHKGKGSSINCGNCEAFAHHMFAQI